MRAFLTSLFFLCRKELLVVLKDPASRLILMPMVLLSGLTTPVRDMPNLMQWLTLANPLRYAIDLVRRVYLEGVGLDAVLDDIWPLVLLALLCLPFAACLFRNRLM